MVCRYILISLFVSFVKFYDGCCFVFAGDWKSIPVDDTAGQVVHSCVVEVHSLVESLLQGHVPFGHLMTCLNNKHQFKRIYQQCMDVYSGQKYKQPFLNTVYKKTMMIITS